MLLGGFAAKKHRLRMVAGIFRVEEAEWCHNEIYSNSERGSGDHLAFVKNLIVIWWRRILRWKRTISLGQAFGGSDLANLPLRCQGCL